MIRTDDRSRAVGIVGVVAVHLALGMALLHGLGVPVSQPISDSLTLLKVLPPPPPPPPPPRVMEVEYRVSPRKAGRSAPPNLRAKATEVVAPKPILPPPTPPPIPVAPVAGIGMAPAAGAAPIAGPGTGSGGVGNGTGSGGSGDGDGGGGGMPPVLVSGHVSWPGGVARRYDHEVVGLRFTVGVKGRVTACTVTRPSGYPPLDAVVCSLIEAKLRYRPSRDATGRAIPSVVVGSQTFDAHYSGAEHARDDDEDELQ